MKSLINTDLKDMDEDELLAVTQDGAAHNHVPFAFQPENLNDSFSDRSSVSSFRTSMASEGPTIEAPQMDACNPITKLRQPDVVEELWLLSEIIVSVLSFESVFSYMHGA